MTLIVQPDWRLSSGCQFIFQKFYEINDTSFNDSYSADYYTQNIGEIWQYLLIEYYGGYSGSELQRIENLYPILPLTGSRTINTTFDVLIYDRMMINGYPHAKLRMEMFHSDGTSEVFDYGQNVFGLTDAAFYVCGCNENDLRCGECCVSCCDLAKLVRDSYQNKLL